MLLLKFQGSISITNQYKIMKLLKPPTFTDEEKNVIIDFLWRGFVATTIIFIIATLLIVIF